MSIRKKKLYSEQIKRTAVIFGGVYAAVGFIVRVMSDSPFDTIHILGAGTFLPPMWIFNVLCLFWMFVCGTAAGAVVAKIFCGRIAGDKVLSIYRGGLFYIALFFLCMLWYPLFFGGNALGVSLLISLLALLCSCVCAFQWKCAGIYETLSMSANSIWLFYILLVNLMTALQV